MSWNITDADELEEAILKLKLKLVKEIGIRNGMTVVDVGCGQGGFTTSLAINVGERGKVLAADISDEYLTECIGRLDKHNVRSRVTFIQADAVNLGSVLPNEVADVVASYRFLEELKQPKAMVKIVKEMARIVKSNGRASIVEMSSEFRNEAEETYIRLHRESGDSLFEPSEILNAMTQAKLEDVSTKKIDSDIWLSPELAKQDLSHAQVWYDEDVKKSLGQLIDKYGMKYPSFLIFSGIKK